MWFIMNITDIQIYTVEEEKLKAFVVVTIDNCFVIRDIKIIAGPQGLFVAMPAKRSKTGEFKDIAHPINRETRVMFEERILKAYNDKASGLRLLGSESA